MPSTSRSLATLCLSLTLAGAAAPIHNAAALGLGAIESSSWLGKPFDARIPINLTAEEGVDPASELKVALGSAADYERLGVEPAAVHRQLLIGIEQHKGATYVRVRTREPLQEPYLDFVLTVRWAQGQLARGFTVFIDPPPTAAVASTPVAAPPGRPASAAAPARASQPPVPLELAAGTYATSRGDSLWRIAREWSQGQRVNAAMDAIIAANPDAFIGGDPERLREGVTLTLPGKQSALAQPVLAQPVLTKAQPALAKRVPPNPRPETTGADRTSASADGAIPDSPAVAPPPPRLEVVAAAPAMPVDVSPENAVYKERVGAINHQVDDLEATLASSRARLEKMDKQLRRLMAAYDRQRGDDGHGDHDNQGGYARQGGGQATLQHAALTLPATAGVGSSQSMAASFGAVGGGTIDAQPLTTTAGASWPTWAVHASYWSAIAALAAWVGWLAWRRQPVGNNGRVSPQGQPAPLPHRPAPAQRSAAVAPPPETPTGESGNAERPKAIDRSGIPIGSLMPTSTFAEESVDAGISAGVFIAFGRMSEAEQVLVEALEHQPDRFDLQMQLLDLYLQTENGAAFERLAESMAAQHADDEAVLDELSILREAYDASRA